MRRLYLFCIFLSLLLLFLPVTVEGQMYCSQPGLQDNCDGSNTDPDACIPDYECVDQDNDPVTPPTCQPCGGYVPGCIPDLVSCQLSPDNCCTGYCNPNVDVCTCSDIGVLCDPDTGMGINGDGLCCTGNCGENPVTSEYACTYDGRICNESSGTCRTTCNIDEAPIGDGEGGPTSDCTAIQTCCVYNVVAEPTPCVGEKTGIDGVCSLLFCNPPLNYYWDGFDPQTPITPTTPTPTPSVPSCNPGNSCLNLDQTQCSSAYGTYTPCANDFGGGTCCAPWSMCASGYSCLNVTQSECQSEGGFYGACSTLNENGSCCAPQTQCQSPLYCYNLTRSDCDIVGYYGACDATAGQGTCCALSSTTTNPSCSPIEALNKLYVCCVPFSSIFSYDDDMSNRPAQDPVCETIEGYQGIETAIGCIPVTSLTQITGFVLLFGLGMGGGIAFLFMIASGFLMLTSAGNPERIRNAKELFVSAISGLILLLFSTFILELIGVKILNLPGF